jgi:hypothetical protein
MAAKQRKAFIAMRFSDDHWKDKRYLAIQEVVEEAGFKCVRADQIPTSGPVVDEVCHLLRDSHLVVIDSSGDSHSVSYEIGYCHGIGRPAEKTVLLRDNATLPFNFRHYRHRVYRDARHLRRLLRDFLAISEPLRADHYGYTFTFDFSDKVHFGYIMDGAACIFSALRHLKFTGRCECWSREHFGRDRMFSVGIMLRRPKGPPTPDYDFCQAAAARVERLAAKSNGRITFDPLISELAEKQAIRDSMVWCGAAQLDRGKIVQVLEIAEDRENFFHHYLTDYDDKV